ncbi:hypothetical protein [Ruminococcus flavefaciens]|uniref:hypothetical protein n=1 Tax=Ruminococcus flavefaciens TaxID=1265 RepID=UPI003EFEB16D
MDEFMEEMNRIVNCKYCGRPTLYGELTWLNGKCMCPRCYKKEREKEDGDDNRRDTQMARQSLPG